MKFTLRRRSMRHQVQRLTLLPMIDVMMCCLFYFITAGSLSPAESDLSSALRAEAAVAGSGSELQAQVVQVESSGGATQFRIGSWRLGNRSDLSRVLARLPKQAGIVVRVNGDVPVSAAAAALQACRDAGFVKVSYVPAR